MMNLNSLHDESSDEPRPLSVAIVGAGIGGLTAAISLRQAGHNVQVYESSRFALETGAAIHLPSNANGILRRIGIKAEDHGAVDCNWVSEYRPNGDRVFLRDLTAVKRAFPHPWQLCHRIDLHNALKETAASEGVEIFLQSRVVKLDLENSEITLVNGKTVRADLIIGADGTHSTTRKYVAGPGSVSKLSGTSAFRFLISVNAVKSDPITSHFCELKGELRLHYGNSRRIVIYPCRKNIELNFVCLHPDEESEGNDGDWNQSASKELVLKIFDEYPADVKALLAKAQPETIKLWKLLDLPALAKWTKGNFALIGDAAHPFLPHQGQGGAQAIEDGAALGAMFPLGTFPEEIEDRLKLYQEARYERATTIQQYTRDSAFKTKRGDHGGKVMDPMQFTEYNFDHDAFDHASGILKRHLASRAVYRRMPLSFGPCAGPRQGFSGRARAGVTASAEYSTAFVTFKTRKSYLSSLLPSSDFKIKSQGGWTTATFLVTRLMNLKWLGGRGYTHFGLYIHNVEHTGGIFGRSIDAENDEKMGDYLPVLFENMADPIITGREELGFSKVFAALDEKRLNSSYELSASWENTGFCHIRLAGLEKEESRAVVPNPPLYHRKIISSSNEAGKVDVEYNTISNLTLAEGKMENTWSAKEAEISFTALKGRELEDAFPTLANIIDGLRRVEVEEIITSGIRSFP